MFFPEVLKGLRSNFNTREFNSRENYRFYGHNSEPCRNFGTILRRKLPIITPDLPIPTRGLNSSAQPKFLNPKFLYKTEQTSRVLTAERKHTNTCFALFPGLAEAFWLLLNATLESTGQKFHDVSWGTSHPGWPPNGLIGNFPFKWESIGKTTKTMINKLRFPRKN